MADVGDEWLLEQVRLLLSGERRKIYEGMCFESVKLLVVMRLSCALEFSDENMTIYDAFVGVTEMHECGYSTIETREGPDGPDFSLVSSDPDIEGQLRPIWNPKKRAVVRYEQRSIQ
jgi:hypothetical protein